MRILHLLAQIPGNTGSGIYLQNMLAYFTHRRYPQAVVVGVPQGFTPELAAEQVFPIEFDSLALPFAVPGMSDVMPYRSSRYSDLNTKQLERLQEAYRQTVMRAIEQFEPDIIISHHLWLMSARVVEAVVSQERVIPVVGVCHGTDLRQRALLPVLAEQVRPWCARLDRVLALNFAQQLEIYDWLKLPWEHIQVIGNGFDRELFAPQEVEQAPERIDFVYAGKLCEAKGVGCLLSAFAKLSAPENVQVHLYLAGSGQGEEAQALLARVEQMADVTYVGMLAQEHLAELFNRCDIFVLPSFFEGLPLVLAEALSCGLAVVSSELHGVPQWLGEEISASSRFIQVPLPALEQVDRPRAEEKPLFIQRLSEAMERSMQHQLDDAHGDLPDLTHLAWDGVFYQVEQELKGLLWG